MERLVLFESVLWVRYLVVYAINRIELRNTAAVRLYPVYRSMRVWCPSHHARRLARHNSCCCAPIMLDY